MNAKKHYLVMGAGSGGDVAPMAQIAIRIAERGYGATLMAPKRYQAMVGETQVAFESLGADDVFEDVFSGSAIWNPKTGLKESWRYYGAAMNASLDRIRSSFDVERTALVSSSFAVGARLAEECFGYQNTTVHLSPSVIFSAVSPPVWPAMAIPESWPVPVKRALVRAAERWATDPVIGAHVNTARRRLGKPDAHALFSGWLNSPRRVIYAFPEWFAASASDWPRQGIFAGFPKGLSRAEPLPRKLESILSNDVSRPLVVITAGTAVAGRPAWVGSAEAASRRQGARVVVVEPGDDRDGVWIDDNVLSVPFAPFQTLLPQTQLLIHHGGIGTIAQALRSATAQLIVPTAHDQFDNAARAQHLGIGSKASKRAMVQNADQLIACSLRQAGTERAAKIPMLAADLECDGASTIADCVIAESRAYEAMAASRN